MHPIVRESAKLAVNTLHASWATLSRTAGLIDFPVPPYSSMRKTSSRTIRHYYVSGVACYLPIATMALHQGVALREPIRVLDFGCGVGRQLLHFTKHFPKVQFEACDVDSTLIDFIRKHYPDVAANVTKFDPPLPFKTSSLDMIYSVSTFSHIHPENQRQWLDELFRVTKPSGYCFLTTEGWTALGLMRDVFLADMDAKLRERGILYKEYEFLKYERGRDPISPLVNVARGISGSYGNTVMTPNFIRENWAASGFEVVDVIEGVIDTRQDLIILRKPE